MELYRIHGEKKTKTLVTKGRSKKEKAPSKEKKFSSGNDLTLKPVQKRSRDASDAKAPAAKRGKVLDNITISVNESKPDSFVHQRIAKDFDGETFFGTIVAWDDSENPPFWHVEYDDGDEEDYSKRDLIKALKHYDKHNKNDPNKRNDASDE